jgi:hypothetical protein
MTNPSEGFADNWAYLRTELRWLEQVLMVAVARQRKETHDIERIAQSKADRATSAWWKGIITTEGKAVYDEHRQPQSGAKTSYHQQLEAKIQVSSQKGVLLALPALRDRLQLTLFEKNLVLMSLAPEVNRRYAKLYRYLQGEDTSVKTDLPTLDLVLRLMCRNDNEWRSARHRLVTSSPLIRLQLLEFLPQTTDSLLNYPLKLTAPLVDYLLAEQPTQDGLEVILQSSIPPIAPTPEPPPHLLRQPPITDSSLNWSDLVLPTSVLSGLHYRVQQIQGQAEAQARWGVLPQKQDALGTIALFVGTTGTGKTLAAEVIARSLQTPLCYVDLAQIEPAQYPQLLQEIKIQAPVVLLLKSASLWLGRSTVVSPFLSSAQIHQFFAQRRQINGITLLTTHHTSAIQVHWRQAVDQIIPFPLPNAADRLRLWKKAFPASVPLSPEIDWNALAEQVVVSGGAIVQLAQAAIRIAAMTGAEQVEGHHLAEVLLQQGKPLKRSIVLSSQPSSSNRAKAKKATQPTASRSSARSIAPLSSSQKTGSYSEPNSAPANSSENQSEDQSEDQSGKQSEKPPETLVETPQPSIDRSPSRSAARKNRKAAS